MFKLSKTFSLVGLIFCGFICFVSLTCWVYLIMKNAEPGNLPFLTLLSGFTAGMYGFTYKAKRNNSEKNKDYGSDKGPTEASKQMCDE